MGSDATPPHSPTDSSTSRAAAYDLVVVGGGINGAGIARDAAGRGLRVLLCERDDLASHTSSASSKLVHGGLRYLEHYEFRLVAKALAEREMLLRAAPHIVRPLRFVMPHVPELRPRWMMRVGLFLYDHLDLRRHKLLPGSRGIRLSEHPAGAALRPELRDGYEYSDAWVDDARLVVLTALDAAQRGATIATRTACVSARRDGGHWEVELEDATGRRTVRARALVNACGPWAGAFLEDTVAGGPKRPLRLVKGSHIVVPRLFDHDYAYILQNPDRRVVFALPFEDDFTLVGTTEVEFRGDPGTATITDAEVEYLCSTVARFFRKPVAADDIVHTFAGVRPLIGDEEINASAVTRDYQLDLDTEGPPLLSVLGGKLTTYRKLAEEAMNRLGPLLDCSTAPWTETAQLPGGSLEPTGLDGLRGELEVHWGWLDQPVRERLARSYGTYTLSILRGVESIEDLGAHFGGGLYERELRYLVANEWACTAEDVVWRRTRVGLRLDAAQVEAIEAWLAKQARPRSAVATR